MIFPSVSARSAPCLVEPSTTCRSTAAADPILAGVMPTPLSLDGPSSASIMVRRHPKHHPSVGECTDTEQRHTGRVSTEWFIS